MQKSYRVGLGIITIMIMITITVGTSYAYYLVSSPQTNENVVITSCFDFDVVSQKNSVINLDSAYPMTEAQALNNLSPYTFSVTNNCQTKLAQDINYTVTLSTLENSNNTMDQFMMYKLNETSPNQLLGSTSNLTSAQVDEKVSNKDGITTSYALDVGTLAPGETKTYDLYLWIDKNATGNVMGETFKSQILVYGYLGGQNEN